MLIAFAVFLVLHGLIHLQRSAVGILMLIDDLMLVSGEFTLSVHSGRKCVPMKRPD